MSYEDEGRLLELKRFWRCLTNIYLVDNQIFNRTDVWMGGRRTIELPLYTAEKDAFLLLVREALGKRLTGSHNIHRSRR